MTTWCCWAYHLGRRGTSLPLWVQVWSCFWYLLVVFGPFYISLYFFGIFSVTAHSRCDGSHLTLVSEDTDEDDEDEDVGTSLPLRVLALGNHHPSHPFPLSWSLPVASIVRNNKEKRNNEGKNTFTDIWYFTTKSFCHLMNSNIQGRIIVKISPQQGRILEHDVSVGQTLLHTQDQALLTLQSPLLGEV